MAPTAVPSESRKRRLVSWTTGAGRSSKRRRQLPFHLWLGHIARDHSIGAHRHERLAQRRSVDREQALHAVRPDESSLDWAAPFLDQELTPASAAMRHEMERKVQEAIRKL